MKINSINKNFHKKGKKQQNSIKNYLKTFLSKKQNLLNFKRIFYQLCIFYLTKKLIIKYSSKNAFCTDRHT